MRSARSIKEVDIENLMSASFGSPKGDELPQVAGLEDILVDVYSDMLNIPREYAAGRFHHQINVRGYEETKEFIH
ncbi:MAG: hypothetical protein DI551_11915 [Micavibrio aeruginosavorus]|uniref:Uncharacterized protein n=1 Tax=Micavibrio aeruginosavorus TaxID=349221 RepID=A0A2W5PLZ0_9BACT|nr:MAG: hypothetical protein DI551_11915 [Micavibrio aeruginosavorus]